MTIKILKSLIEQSHDDRQTADEDLLKWHICKSFGFAGIYMLDIFLEVKDNYWPRRDL